MRGKAIPNYSISIVICGHVSNQLLLIFFNSYLLLYASLRLQYYTIIYDMISYHDIHSLASSIEISSVKSTNAIIILK